MAEDRESNAGGVTPGGPDAAAFAAAMGVAAHDAAVAAQARLFLEEQTRLSRAQVTLVHLQSDDLRREDRIRHWSLRVRHISDVMKLAFELSAAIILLTIVVFVGTAIWLATQDDALVINAFNVPADMAARGLTGQVVATQIQDRLTWMQAHTDSIRQASSYANNWSDDIKVQIPDTGVSIGEFYHYLAGWLGHQTHISGELYQDSNRLTLSARIGTYAAAAYSGAGSDIAKLVEQAAEGIYRQTQPYRYIVYLDTQNRQSEELAAMRLLALNGAVEDRPWVYSRWGTYLGTIGDLNGSLEKQRIAEKLAPNLPHVAANLASIELELGHDEAALTEFRHSVALGQSPASRHLARYAVTMQTLFYGMTVDEFLGDYRKALTAPPRIQPLQDYSGGREAARIMMIVDLAADHDVSASRQMEREEPNAEMAGAAMWTSADEDLVVLPLPGFLQASTLDDWQTARADVDAYLRAPAAKPPGVTVVLPVMVWPWLAYADARTGDVAAARELIEKTPRDCYLCVRMRGNIAAVERNWVDANRWFAEATRQAPSIPFAYTDWGRMLMAKGDIEGAIAKFKQANAKGPHFADPLEMWGEALMLKNRSDLALAKFAEGDKYAPNWGRLHLEWGEALFYSGKTDEARKQFTTASTLDLSPSDKAAMTNWRARK